MFLYRLAHRLEENKIRYALVGGYAVALQGAVRGTVDVDIAIRLTRPDFVALERALKTLGLESKLPVTAEQVFDFREEYIARRNLIAWNFFNPKNPVETVDVLLTEDAGKMRVDAMKIGTSTLRVASIEDLIRMKTISGRPQDLADVDALKKLKKVSP